MKSSQILISLTASLLVAGAAVGADKNTKGLMPELRADSSDENINTRKAVQTEVLITKTENQAIQSLVNILKKKKGSPQEADLWYRLAELYMRRSKTGRFFDLNRGEAGPVQFLPPEISGESAAASLKRAVQVYTKIEREFPHFRDMDAVLFNNAFASQQLKLQKNAEALYTKMVHAYRKSPLLADAYLALGEIAYEAGNFTLALEHLQAIEKYPQARVYSYGLYKSAWALYNLKKNEPAIEKLVEVVKYQDPKKQTAARVNHNLRAEALRDLTLFYGESQPPESAYSFFSQIATPDEVGEAIFNLGRLYDSFSRHQELNVFLNDFIQRQPLSKFRVKMEILMVNANETARNRPLALEHLIAGHEICKLASPWRQGNADIAELECDENFSRANIEIAKKWWELWQKNKAATQAREIADCTQQAFRLHLERENPAHPDTRSRFAYAELLFQLNDFRKASEQYEIVAGQNGDPSIRHQASYGALVALEKASEKKTQTSDPVNLDRLARNYLKDHPQGEHTAQVQFKLGFIAYEQGQHTEAEKWLTP